MSKRCRHTHARYQLRHFSGRVTQVFGCYMIVAGPDGDNFGYGSSRVVLSAICDICEATLSLGPSNDWPAEVGLEMNAAERIAAVGESDSDAWCGDGTTEIAGGPWQHDFNRAYWAWDISRPIAEQLAETLLVDAEADGLAVALAEVERIGRGYPPANEAADFDPFTCPVIPGDFGGPHGAIPIPEHSPDPACTCDATAPDAATAIALGWTFNDGKWRCPFWAADVGEVVA